MQIMQLRCQHPCHLPVCFVAFGGRHNLSSRFLHNAQRVGRHLVARFETDVRAGSVWDHQREYRAADRTMVQCLHIPTSVPTVLLDSTTAITTVGLLAECLSQHVSNEIQQTTTTTELALKMQRPPNSHIMRVPPATRLSTMT